MPPDWALAHIRYAATGAACVAGMADLDRPQDLTTEAQHTYRSLVAERTHGDHHDNIYGANLGVRADAYLAVGGFPHDDAGEDQLLWNRLADAGYAREQPSSLRVYTSSRIYGRAVGGLADLLHALHAPEPVTGPDTAPSQRPAN